MAVDVPPQASLKVPERDPLLDAPIPPPTPLVKVAGTLLGVAVIAAFGLADYATGHEIWLSIFYLLPVVAAGWVLGRSSAVVLALAASIAWLLSERIILGPVHLGVSLWNAGSRLVIFSTLGVLTAVVRNDRYRLRMLLERERHNARTDSLTGLGNSRAFYDLLSVELARVARSGRPLCLAMVDLDNFKRVNDTFGHPAGDDLLHAVAGCLRRCLRATDVAVRQGGDEFAVLFFDVEFAEAEAIAARIVTEIGHLGEAFPGAGLGASMGLTYCRRAPSDVGELVRRADTAMYRAKSDGKGRVCVDVLE